MKPDYMHVCLYMVSICICVYINELFLKWEYNYIQFINMPERISKTSFLLYVLQLRHHKIFDGHSKTLLSYECITSFYSKRFLVKH